MSLALYPWCLVFSCHSIRISPDSELDVASDCSSVGAMTVTMLTECANVSDIRYEFSLVSMVFRLVLTVVIELEYHLELDVASDCPSVGAMTVTMLTECANVSDIRYEFSLVSMVFGV